MTVKVSRMQNWDMAELTLPVEVREDLHSLLKRKQWSAQSKACGRSRRGNYRKEEEECKGGNAGIDSEEDDGHSGGRQR